jgi:hypothetical protein
MASPRASRVAPARHDAVGDTRPLRGLPPRATTIRPSETRSLSASSRRRSSRRRHKASPRAAGMSNTDSETPGLSVGLSGPSTAGRRHEAPPRASHRLSRQSETLSLSVGLVAMIVVLGSHRPSGSCRRHQASPWAPGTTTETLCLHSLGDTKPLRRRLWSRLRSRPRTSFVGVGDTKPIRRRLRTTTSGPFLTYS